jgi:hypothetical protein
MGTSPPPARLVVIAACSNRKRLAAEPQRRLRELAGRRSDAAVREWTARMKAPGARRPAIDLYAGEHWQNVLEGVRRASRHVSVELWVASAGAGLVSAETQLPGYSATFASTGPDRVWVSAEAGGRKTALTRWWRQLSRIPLAELVRDSSTAVLIVAGADYVDAMADDLTIACAEAQAPERLTLVSAQRTRHPVALDFGAGLRGHTGGTLSALNARVLVRLAERADEHGFAREGMQLVLRRAAESAPAWRRPKRRPLDEAALAAWIARALAADPTISTTRALRTLRGEGQACEQGRFREALFRARSGRVARVQAAAG